MSTKGSTWLVFLALAPLLGGVDVLLRRSRTVEQGNSHMKSGKAQEALAEYDKALGEAPNEPGVHFNRGTALYGLSRWEESAQAFLRATEGKTPDLKAAAFYNLGNAFFQAGKFGEAASAFKKSLAYNPGDVRAKWNLELALRKKQEEDKKSEEKKDEKKDDKQKQANKGKDDPKDPTKGDQDKQNQNQDQNQQDQKNDQKKEPDKNEEQAKQDPPKPPEDKPKPGEQKPQPQPDKQAQNEKEKKGPDGKPLPKPPSEVSEMEAILDNLERSPKALEQELARLRALNRKPPAKDW